MTAYGILKSLNILVFVVLVALGGMGLCISNIYRQISLESVYSEKFGEGWRDVYESNIGSLTKAHTRTAISAVGVVAIGLVSVWLGKILVAEKNPGSTKQRKDNPRRRRFGSSIERTVYYRRNALLGIYSGLIAIFAGIALVLIRFGLFKDHADEAWLGLMVFLCGYVGVIAGCYWWLKAKEWDPSVALIGLMPLGIFFIPFVRLVLVSSPEILPIGMFFAALILIVVVFVLPDKSAASAPTPRWSKRSSSRNQTNERKSGDD